MQTAALTDIHPYEWANVKCKARVKKVLAAITKAGKPLARIYVSPAFGSVYVEIGREWDENYGWLGTSTVRVSDHERTSDDHAYPDFNIFDAASFEAAISEIAGA